MSNSSAETPLLAFGAHPDDVEFGCGGVIAREVLLGRRAHLVVCSRGEAGTAGTPEVRESEARDGAAILGASLEFLELDGDAHLSASAAHAMTIAAVIRRVRPAVVLAPTPHENQHPDHARLGGLVRDAARLARYGGIEEMKGTPTHAIGGLFYYALSLEAEPPGAAPILVDVSDERTLSTWTAAMEAHASQTRARGYVDLQLTRARLRGLSAGIGYAVAIFPADSIIVDSLEAVSRGARHF